MIEVEYYRRLAEGALRREIASVRVPDPHCLGDHLSPAGLRRSMLGRCFDRARRHGKLLLLDTDGPTVGIRFGMTGGLVVDDRLAVDRLLYSAGAFGSKWVRLEVGFADRGSLALHDPRRFGRVVLDPDEGTLGPDALDVTPSALRAVLASRVPGGGPPLKARLQDQAHLAGIGNLLADEILWRAALSPWRPSGSLEPAELRRLHRALRATLTALSERGGSHTGDLMAERRPGGHCPRDGAPLTRDRVGGRTTWWCPAHQL
jgi:formamidopyrimidine-DNA glycosylase